MNPEGRRPVEINSLETFQSFFDSYVSDILTNPPSKKPFPKKLPSDPFHSMLYLDEANPFQAEFVRNRLKNAIFITGVAWDILPESLQDLLTTAYDSAAVDIKKTVSFSISENNMLFHLESSRSYDYVDWSGDYYTYGVSFLRTKTPFIKELERALGGKEHNEGEFMFRKLPLSREIRHNSILERSLKEGQELTSEEKEFLERCMEEDRSGEFTQIIPASLIHLQDIARVLESQRQNAFVYSA